MICHINFQSVDDVAATALPQRPTALLLKADALKIGMLHALMERQQRNHCSVTWTSSRVRTGWTYDSSTAICHSAESQGKSRVDDVARGPQPYLSSGRCSTLSASLSTAEKKQSSRDCLAPWPCQGLLRGSLVNALVNHTSHPV